MNELKECGSVPKWGMALDGTFSRRSVMMGELKRVGVKVPEQISVPSVRNDVAFLASVVGVSSVLAVGASFLPGAALHGKCPCTAYFASLRLRAYTCRWCIMETDHLDLMYAGWSL